MPVCHHIHSQLTYSHSPSSPWSSVTFLNTCSRPHPYFDLCLPPSHYHTAAVVWHFLMCYWYYSSSSDTVTPSSTDIHLVPGHLYSPSFSVVTCGLRSGVLFSHSANFCLLSSLWLSSHRWLLTLFVSLDLSPAGFTDIRLIWTFWNLQKM